VTGVWFDPQFDDVSRRQALYRGDIIVYSPTEASSELVRFTREFMTEAFSGLDPETAQHRLPVAEYAAILGQAKPRFIHHERNKAIIRNLLRELGCDSNETYFDVPRLRTSTCNDYLTTGIAYAFHPHRDTWYSAPMCQVNWWIPIYDLAHDNGMAFHPQYWDRPVPNTSRIYDYQEWNRKNRFSAAKHIGKDTRPQPRASVKVDTGFDLRLLPRPGSVIVFSAAQLHSSIPNTSSVTRVSVDFRTVNESDVRTQAGAPNVDSCCSGSTMGDYRRVEDLAALPDALTAPYAGGPPQAPKWSEDDSSPVQRSRKG
jgi:hypothetical protein